MGPDKQIQPPTTTRRYKDTSTKKRCRYITTIVPGMYLLLRTLDHTLLPSCVTLCCVLVLVLYVVVCCVVFWWVVLCFGELCCVVLCFVLVVVRPGSSSTT